MTTKPTEAQERKTYTAWADKNWNSFVSRDYGIAPWIAGRAALRAELAALAATPAEPAGFVLVPIAPTDEMIGTLAVIEASGNINGVPTFGMAGAEEAYEAFLAARELK